MTKTRSVANKARRPAKKTKKVPGKRRARVPDPLLATIPGVTRIEAGGVVIDVGHAGAARVKRAVYPAGFHWAEDMKPAVGTELCMHAHVGFLARGEIHIEYADGCVVQHKAPQVVVIEPGHDGWVVGRQPAVLIEFDFERDTIRRLGMPTSHEHPPG